jgi:hypothetical protein
MKHSSQAPAIAAEGLVVGALLNGTGPSRDGCRSQDRFELVDTESETNHRIQWRKHWFDRLHRKNRSCKSEGNEKLKLLNDSSTVLLGNSMSSIDSSNVSLRTIPTKQPTRQVSFSVAEYREYKVTVAVSYGVAYAMTLDWSYGDSKVIQLSELEDRERRPMVPLNMRKRQQRFLTMGMSKPTLVALERQRQILIAGEWAFGNNSKMRPTFACGKILQYTMY